MLNLQFDIVLMTRISTYLPLTVRQFQYLDIAIVPRSNTIWRPQATLTALSQCRARNAVIGRKWVMQSWCDSTGHRYRSDSFPIHFHVWVTDGLFKRPVRFIPPIANKFPTFSQPKSQFHEIPYHFPALKEKTEFPTFSRIPDRVGTLSMLLQALCIIS